MTDRPPRHPHLDVAWARSTLRFCEEWLGELRAELAAAGAPAGQIELVLAVDLGRDAGLLRYALGDDLATVRRHLADAAEACERVFELRGLEPALDAVVVDGEDVRAVHAPGARDHSLTNSRRGLLAMHLALAVGDRPLATRIARLVGDPPDASYLGDDSVVCTWEEQRLAYALRDLLAGDPAGALAAPAAMPAGDLGAAAQAELLAALAARDGTAVRGALARLLAWHRAEAEHEANAHDVRRLLSLPATALAALAVADGVVPGDALPRDEPYLARMDRRGARD
jgi:hypothetical protein